MDETIAKYIAKQDPAKQKLLEKARALLLATIPGCAEEYRWGVLAYDGGKFYIAAMKTRIHVGFAIIGLEKDEIKEFEGGGKTMRHIKIHSMDEFDPQRLTRLIKLVHKKATAPSV